MSEQSIAGKHGNEKGDEEDKKVKSPRYEKGLESEVTNEPVAFQGENGTKTVSRGMFKTATHESEEEAKQAISRAEQELEEAEQDLEEAEQDLEEAKQELKEAKLADDIESVKTAQKRCDQANELVAINSRRIAYLTGSIKAILERMTSQQQLINSLTQQASEARTKPDKDGTLLKEIEEVKKRLDEHQQSIAAIKEAQKFTSTTFKPTDKLFYADATKAVHINPDEISNLFSSHDLRLEDHELFEAFKDDLEKIKSVDEDALQAVMMKFLNMFYKTIIGQSDQNPHSTIARDTRMKNCGLRDAWGSVVVPNILLTPQFTADLLSIAAFYEKAIIELKKLGKSLEEEEQAQLCRKLQAALYHNFRRPSIWGMLTNGLDVVFIQAIQPTNTHGIMQSQQRRANAIRYEIYHSYPMTHPIGRQCVFAFLTAPDDFYCMYELVLSTDTLGKCVFTADLGSGVSGHIHQITVESTKKNYAIKYFTDHHDFLAEKENLEKIADGLKSFECIDNIVRIVEVIAKERAIIMTPVGFSVRDFQSNKLDANTVTQWIKLVTAIHNTTGLVNYDLRDNNLVFTRKSKESPWNLVSVDWVYAFQAGLPFQPCGTIRYAAPDVLDAIKKGKYVIADLKHAYQSIVRVFYDCVSQYRYNFQNPQDPHNIHYVKEVEEHWARLSCYLWCDAEQAAIARNEEQLITILTQCYEVQANKKPLRLKPQVE